MAENVAMTADRIFLTARLGMLGSFRRPRRGLRVQGMLCSCECQLLLNIATRALGPRSLELWAARSGVVGWGSACRSRQSVSR